MPRATRSSAVALALAALAAALAGLATLAASAAPATPPPPPPPLDAATTPPDADPDARAIEAVVAGIYAAISGEAGAPRDWDRFRTLLAPDARLMAITPAEGGGTDRVTMTVDTYVANATRMFAARGFHECGVIARTDRYGHIAHVFSVYESRRAPADAEPFDRGVNSIQLAKTGGTWRVVSILWDNERTGGPVPAGFDPR